MLKNSKVVLFVTLKSRSGRKLLDPTTYIRIRVKYPLFLSDLNLIFCAHFWRKLTYQISRNSIRMGPNWSVQPDGKRGRHDESKQSRFSTFCTRPKYNHIPLYSETMAVLRSIQNTLRGQNIRISVNPAVHKVASKPKRVQYIIHV